MTASLVVRRHGPQMTLQDLGRPGYLAQGLSRGGAADRLALLEGAALLGAARSGAALEMAGAGGAFEATAPIRVALTGAPMTARVDGRPLEWNASHRLPAGARLEIGPAQRGVYGYLSVPGGFGGPEFLGSRSTHLVAGLGAAVTTGDTLPATDDPDTGAPPLRLDVSERCKGGVVRVVPGAQTGFFSDEMRARFADTEFTRDRRGNRQGVRLTSDAPPFTAEGQRTILSEVIVPGDIQMTGDGTPFVLLPECQTTGGYPRIGSVVPEDLPIVAQAAPGVRLRFRFVDAAAIRQGRKGEADEIQALRKRASPLVRDPHDIADLLSYQLVSGMISGAEEDGEQETRR